MSELLKRFEEFAAKPAEVEEKKTTTTEPKQSITPEVEKPKRKLKIQPITPSWATTNEQKILWVCLKFDEIGYGDAIIAVNKIFPYISPESITRFMRFLRTKKFLSEVGHSGVFRPTAKGKARAKVQ